jgi:hypothetical protein
VDAMPRKWREIHRFLSVQAEVQEYAYRRDHLNLLEQLIKKPGLFG